MSTATRPATDRAARLRAALREVVAERGLHDASVGAIAGRAGVAAGTVYVHYGSKDELVAAAWAEAKNELGEAAVAAVSPGLPPRERFIALWLAVHDHLALDPAKARFLIQVDASPYARQPARSPDADGPNALERFAATADMAELLIAVPQRVLYGLALGPAVSIAATGEPSDRDELQLVANACWRAITTASA